MQPKTVRKQPVKSGQQKSMQQLELGQSMLVNTGVKLPRFLCPEQQPAQTEVSCAKPKSNKVNTGQSQCLEIMAS